MRIAEQGSFALPSNPLDSLLDPDGNGEDDLLETRFNLTLDSCGMAEFTKTTLAVLGALHITRKNERKWMVFGLPNDRLDDELMFFGELYVSESYPSRALALSRPIIHIYRAGPPAY